MLFGNRAIWRRATQQALRTYGRPGQRSLDQLGVLPASRVKEYPAQLHRSIWTDHVIPPSNTQHELYRHDEHTQPRAQHQHPNEGEVVTKHEEPLESYQTDGFHPVNIGDLFNAGRYEVVRKLGWGRYSTVWLAFDREKRCHVALKILSAKASNTTNCYGLPELEMLNRAMCTDPTHLGFDNIVALIDHFSHTGPNGTHKCLVMEAMADNMSGLEARNPDRKVPLHAVKKMTKQVLMALDYLHEHCRIVHSDIKPDNIMITSKSIEPAIVQTLRDDTTTHSTCTLETPYRNVPVVEITPSRPLSQLLSRLYDEDPDGSQMTFKLGDLGVSNFVDDHYMERIQPLALRCPEVIIGAPWDTAADIWNFACVIYEELAGRWLFNPGAGVEPHVSSIEHLCQITELFGHLPEDLLAKGKHTPQFYDSSNRLMRTRDFHPVLLEALLLHWSDLSPDEARNTASFLGTMLKVQPSGRLSAGELLRHDWLAGI